MMKQITIDEWLGLGSWSGRMSMGAEAPTVAMTSEPSWKKWQGLSTRPSLFLDLTRASGRSPAISSEMNRTSIQSHGEPSMHNSGVCRSAEDESAWLQIGTDGQQWTSSSNTMDAPITPIPTHLIDILEWDADPKYDLSPKACQGILNRAERRGKKLPKMLEEALRQVIATELPTQCRTVKDVQGGKGALIQADRSASLRTVNNQYLFEPVVYATHGFGEPSASAVNVPMTAEQNNHVRGDTPLVVQPFKKGAHPRNSEEPQVWKEAVVSDTSKTFNVSETRTPTVVVEGKGGIVSFGHDERGSRMTEDGITDPVTASDYKQPITVAYEEELIALDRASYNQGMNAQFGFEARNDGGGHTIIAKGPGAVAYKDVEIYAGNGNEGGKRECTLVSRHAGQDVSDMSNIVTEQVKAVDCRNATFGSIAGSLQSAANHNLNSNNVIRVKYRVRRLTPTECSRLQGYPDGWCDIDTYVDSKGKVHKVSDANKYKALGNSIALPSWVFVLRRIIKQYREYVPTMASLFDGLGGFPLIWECIAGKGTAIWASEIEEYPIAVTKERFREE